MSPVPAPSESELTARIALLDAYVLTEKARRALARWDAWNAQREKESDVIFAH